MHYEQPKRSADAGSSSIGEAELQQGCFYCVKTPYLATLVACKEHVLTVGGDVIYSDTHLPSTGYARVLGQLAPFVEFRVLANRHYS